MVNISSVNSVMPGQKPMSAYAAAKAAQDKLTQDLAFEFAPKGVRVNSILPGVCTCRHMLPNLKHPLAISMHILAKRFGN